MIFILKYIWIVFVGVTFANVYILRQWTEKYVIEKPERKAGYESFFRGVIIYGNIPWVIIGIGNTLDLTRTVFDYLNPKTLNPMVLIFHGAIVLLWLLSIRWIYLSGGAEFLETHPGLFVKRGLGTKPEVSAREIKLWFPFFILGGVVAMVLMWVKDMPTFP